MHDARHQLVVRMRLLPVPTIVALLAVAGISLPVLRRPGTRDRLPATGPDAHAANAGPVPVRSRSGRSGRGARGSAGPDQSQGTFSRSSAQPSAPSRISLTAALRSAGRTRRQEPSGMNSSSHGTSAQQAVVRDDQTRRPR